MVVRKCSKAMCYIIGVLVLLFFILVGSAFLWLVTGEREVPFFTKTIDSLTTSVLPGYTVDVASHHLTWDGWRNALKLRAYAISIKNSKDNEVAFIPDISVNFNMWHLLYGRIAPNQVLITDPEIRVPYTIPQTLPSSENLTSVSNALYPHVNKFMLLLADTQREHISLKRLNINNGNVVFTTYDGNNFTWHLSNVSGKVTADKQYRTLDLNISSEINGVSLPLQAALRFANNQSANLKLSFNQLEPKTIVSELPDTLLPSTNFLQHSDIKTSGWFDMSFNSEGKIQLTELTIESAVGTLTSPSHFSYDIPVKLFHFKGSLSENYSLLNINQLEADFDGPRLKLTGMAKLDMLDGAILADFSVIKLPTDRLKQFWPPHLIPSVRQWVTTHIAGGVIESSQGNISINLNEILQNKLRKDAINITADMKKTSIQYSTAFPKVTDVDAQLHFNGVGAKFTISQAKQNDVVLTESAILTIPAYSANPPVINIKGKAKGPAIELVHIYESALGENPHILKAPLKSVTGLSNTNFTIDVPLDNNSSKKLELDLKTTLSDITLDNLLGHGQLTQGNLNLHLNNNAVTLNGTGIINTIPTVIKFEKELNNLKSKPFSSTYLFKSHISSEELKNLKLPYLSFIKNKFILAASIEEKENGLDIILHSDFKDAEINLPELQWIKPVDQEAKVDIEASLSDDNTLSIKRFIVASKKLNTRGSAYFSIHPEPSQRIIIDNLIVGETNVHGELELKKNSYKLKVKGLSLDISHIALLKNIQKKNNNSDFLSIEAQLGKLKTENGGLFFNVAGHLHCVINGCFTASLDATMKNKKHFTIAYQPIGANLQDLQITSDNAGEILKVFGIMNNIKEGTLDLNAEMHINKDDPTDKELVGEMVIRDFYAVKTPLLAKLLSVASFTGVMDLLNGNGIPFKKFALPFSKKNSNVEITNAKGHGESIGLTIKHGIINTDEGSVHMKGTIIPAYTVNNFLSNVIKPLGGELLTSGEGQGVLGTTYKVSGHTNNPEVKVNPLSTITPGFLKGIFELKDLPKPPTAEKTQEGTSPSTTPKTKAATGKDRIKPTKNPSQGE